MHRRLNSCEYFFVTNQMKKYMTITKMRIARFPPAESHNQTSVSDVHKSKRNLFILDNGMKHQAKEIHKYWIAM